jgi:hypothetical protein
VYIVVRADHGPSRHNIEKVGFDAVGAARYAAVLGVRVRGRRLPRHLTLGVRRP